MLASLGLLVAVVALAPSPQVATIEPDPLGPRPAVFAGTQLDFKLGHVLDAALDKIDPTIIVRPPATGDRMPADLLANGFAGDPHIFLARPDPRVFVDMMLSGIATVIGSIST